MQQAQASKRVVAEGLTRQQAKRGEQRASRGHGWKTFGSSVAVTLKGHGNAAKLLNDALRALARDRLRTCLKNWQMVPRRSACNIFALALHVHPLQWLKKKLMVAVHALGITEI